MRDLLQQPAAAPSSSGSGTLNDDQVIIIISVVVGTLLLVVVGLGVWYLWWEYRTSTWEEHELAAQAMQSAVTTPSTVAIDGSPSRSPGGDTCKTLVYTPGTVAASPSLQGSPSTNLNASNRVGSDADKMPQPQFWEAEAAARNGQPVNPDSFRLEHVNSSALAQSSSLYGHRLPEGEEKEDSSSRSDADAESQPKAGTSSSSQAAGQEAGQGSQGGSKPNSRTGSPRFVMTGLTAAGVRHVRVNRVVKDEEEIEMSLAPSPAATSTPTKHTADPAGQQQAADTSQAASAGAIAAGSIAAAAAGAAVAAGVAAGSSKDGTGVPPIAKTLVIPSRSSRTLPGRSSSNVSTGTNTQLSLFSRPSGTPCDRGSDAGSVSTITVASHVVGTFPHASVSVGGRSSTAGSVRSDGTASTAVDAGTQTDGTIAMVLLTSSANGSSSTTAAAPVPPAAVVVPAGHITSLAGTALPPSPSPGRPVREIRQVASFAGRWAPAGVAAAQQMPKLSHAAASSPMLEDLTKDGPGSGSVGRQEFRHSASTGNVSAASSPSGTKVMRLVQQFGTYPDPQLDTPGREGSISPSDSAFHTAHATPYSTPYATPPGSRSSETSAAVSSSNNAVNTTAMASSASARLYNNALSMSMQRNVPALPPRSFVPGPNSRSLGRTGSDASTASEHLRMQGSVPLTGTADKDMVSDLDGGTSRMSSPGGGMQGSPKEHETLDTATAQGTGLYSGIAAAVAGTGSGRNQALYGTAGEIEPVSDDDGMFMLPLPPAQGPGTPAR